MQNHKDSLNFNESYNFDVLVREGGVNFAAKLQLTPELCTLRIMGERQFPSNYYTLETIECFTLRNNFLLSGIKLKSLTNTNLRLNDPQNSGGFFEVEFIIDYVIKSTTSVPLMKDTVFKRFNIEADIIKEWTGITKKQSRLLMQNGLNREAEDKNLSLFEVPLENIGILYLSYNLNLHTSLDDISTGRKLTPQLGLYFNENKNIAEIFSEIKKLYSLVSFFWGEEFFISKINIKLHNASSHYVSAYYSHNNQKSKRASPRIPLGFDMVNQFNGYEGLPLSLFGEYYSLPIGKVEYFTKYHRYKRMKSEEEKFLGYFRILERLVHITGTYVNEESLSDLLSRSRKFLINKLNSRSNDIRSLTKKIINSNRGKYVTHDCVSRFFDEIPEDIKKNFSFAREDIVRICALRNDMTHANDYEISEEELYKYTQFIHQLLICALIYKLLNIPLSSLIPISNIFRFIEI